MDDEDIVLQTISKLLELLGHKVTVRYDESEAISACGARVQKGERFGLVIMNLTVAEMGLYKEGGLCVRLEKASRSADH
jgi:CheY-like chemotaxis protein